MRVTALLLLLACQGADPAHEASPTPGSVAEDSVTSENQAQASDPESEADPSTEAPDLTSLVEELHALAEDLWYTSETDSPVRIWSIEEAGDPLPTLATILDVVAPIHVDDDGASPLADRFVAEWTAERFFGRLTEAQAWWDEDQRRDGQHWQQIWDLMQAELAPLRVFRLGERQDSTGEVEGVIDVYVLGATAAGDLVGVHVLSVET
ncbi:MAG: hypothetical protein EA397_00700 [Deltaproteobacteria bacterium]|nr:MAG: hypothetical protein EA397_00700 [Deltaproteobacteria bacterium]